MRAVALRVAGEGDRIHQVSAADERRSRQPPGDRLREAGEIGGHAEVLLRAARRHAEARDDLVEDEGDAALPRELAERAKESGVRGHGHRATARRLEDDGRDLALVTELLSDPEVEVVVARDQRG